MTLVEPTLDSPELAENSSVAVSCTHCGLVVPKGLVESSTEEQFCCRGCKVAYRLIHSCGLDAYYRMAEFNGDASLTHRESETYFNRFDEFDQPSFQGLFVNEVDEDVDEIDLLLDGIHCAACIWLIEKLPRIVPGVVEVKLNWVRQTAHIRWQREGVKLSHIALALHQLGYTPHPIRESQTDVVRQIENRRHLVRIGIAAAAAGNNMLIAASLYLGMFSYMSAGMSQMLRIASCVVGLASLFWPGRVFLKGAISALKTRTPHMDLPIALGLTVGSVAGVINTIRGSGEIYFDSLSVLIFLLLLGRWIQFRQQNRAADAIEMLYRLTPKTTRKIVGGRAVETFADLIEVNDTLEIRSGDLLPVDAVITEGTTEIDESILSGESRMLQKSVGDEVLAGTQNRRSTVMVRATATGRKTRLSKIVSLVEQATLDKPQLVQWANRIGGVFVVAVIGLAAVTLAAWLWIDSSVAVDRTVALLIVACPCALALATPLAISVALGRAAKNRIMIKGGDVLQRLNRPGMIWLDKTGTLTEGRLQVVRWYGDTRLKGLISEAEASSSHPVAKAIVEFVKAEADEDTSSLIGDVIEHEGQGVSTRDVGFRLLVGNAELLRQHDVSIGRRHQQIADRILDANLSPCWVAFNGKVNAILAIGDQVRPETKSAIHQLKDAGWSVGILSGDHQQIVDQVSSRLAIEHSFAHGGLSPEDKVNLVQSSLEQFPTVVMVGDGVNDSAALATASVGVAVHNGAEASLAAAPVYLANEGLQPILELMRISKSTGSTIRKNFGASLSYNVIGATLAAIGWINPLVAAILMPISSLTVVAISLTAGIGKQTRTRS